VIQQHCFLFLFDSTIFFSEGLGFELDRALMNILYYYFFLVVVVVIKNQFLEWLKNSQGATHKKCKRWGFLRYLNVFSLFLFKIVIFFLS
jgi:hypothetical protein